MSNPPPSLVVRFLLSLIKLISFTYNILRHQPLSILILFTSGFSTIEKSLLVFLLVFFSRSVVVAFPRSDLILTQVKRNIFLRISLYLLFRFSHGVVLQSPSFIKALPYLSASKSLVVPNSIDSSLYPFAGPRLPPDPNKPFNVLFVGWLEPVKQVDLIIFAIRQFLDKHESSSISLSIVGDGSCREKLELLCSELELPATFYGWVSSKDTLSSLYAGSNCLCLASRQEGFPNVVLEALIHCLPVISTPVGALPYFFEDNSSILFTSASSSEICQSLEGLYFNHDSRNLIYSRLQAMAPNFDPLVVSSHVKSYVDSFFS